MNTANDSHRNPEDKAPEQPLTLDVEVLEERVAPGFLSGLGLSIPTGRLQDCCD